MSYCLLHLIVDIRQEERVLEILLLRQRVVPVLGLHQQSLDPPNVGSVVEKSSNIITQLVILSQTLGKAIHSLLGSSYRHQVVDLGMRTSLSQTSYKETTLREADSVVSILIVLYYI